MSLVNERQRGDDDARQGGLCRTGHDPDVRPLIRGVSLGIPRVRSDDAGAQGPRVLQDSPQLAEAFHRWKRPVGLGWRMAETSIWVQPQRALCLEPWIIPARRLTAGALSTEMYERPCVS
jgi:hypothetical protein